MIHPHTPEKGGTRCTKELLDTLYKCQIKYASHWMRGWGHRDCLVGRGAQQSYKFVTLMTNQFSQSSHLEMIVD